MSVSAPLIATAQMMVTSQYIGGVSAHQFCADVWSGTVKKA
jgi:hypothetical protein